MYMRLYASSSKCHKFAKVIQLMENLRNYCFVVTRTLSPLQADSASGTPE